ncbi:MAG: hypothetical protein HY804_02490 [Nitrospinae bacterium]|nr:hypothetical protein [Nitrospinota bacterium]
MSGEDLFRIAPHPAHSQINSYGFRVALIRPGAPAHAQELRAFAARILRDMACDLEARGAVDLAHLKLHLDYGEGFLFGSLVGSARSEVELKGKDGADAEAFGLTVNAVVFGVEKAGVREAAEGAVERAVRAYNFRRDDMVNSSGER